MNLVSLLQTFIYVTQIYSQSNYWSDLLKVSSSVFEHVFIVYYVIYKKRLLPVIESHNMRTR